MGLNPKKRAIVGQAFSQNVYPRRATRPKKISQMTIRNHKLVPISLTFDHRAATGGEAARFLAALIADLNLPH
jgi:pyruvate/2-oxoglutarate dehydrogenase complex dihydrolipoamide acyltransferase (E2) component